MKPLLLLILSVLAFNNSAFAQVRLSNRNTYSLKGNIYIFKEQPDDFLSIKETLKYYGQHQFGSLSVPDDNLNLGFTDRVYWLAIPLQNVSNTNVKLEAGITNQGIYHLESYFVLYPSEKIADKNITGKKP